MAAAGVPIGGSHKGFGFASGHPQLRLPSRAAPIKRTVTQRASSVDNRHGSAEQGMPCERESRMRDRSTADADRINDPVQQAGAFRIMPAGPQEAESMQDAYENVINRSLTVEASLRKHAQLIGAQGEALANNYRPAGRADRNQHKEV